MRTVQGTIGIARPASEQRRARQARAASPARGRPGSPRAATKATPTSRYSGRAIAVTPNSRPGQQPGAQSLPLCRPEERQDRGGQGEDRQRLAVEGAGGVDEGRVDGDREGGDQARRPAGDPPPEQEDDDDRRHAEQQLDDPRRPFAGAAGRVEGGGVEQRRPRRPVAGVFEFGAAVAAFGIEGLGERVVGVGVVAGRPQRLDHAVGAQAEAERQDREQQDQRRPPVSLRQRPEPALQRAHRRARLSRALSHRHAGQRGEQRQDDQLAAGGGDQQRPDRGHVEEDQAAGERLEPAPPPDEDGEARQGQDQRRRAAAPARARRASPPAAGSVQVS